MRREQAARWGAWPARIAAAVLVFYGAYLVISGQIALNRSPQLLDAKLGAPAVFVQMTDGVAMVVFGLLIAVLTWLSRRSFQMAAFLGLVLSFFAAGLMVVYALTIGLESQVAKAGLIGGACLLLAALTALIGQPTFEDPEKPHDRPTDGLPERHSRRRGRAAARHRD